MSILLLANHSPESRLSVTSLDKGLSRIGEKATSFLKRIMPFAPFAKSVLRTCSIKNKQKGNVIALIAPALIPRQHSTEQAGPVILVLFVHMVKSPTWRAGTPKLRHPCKTNKPMKSTGSLCPIANLNALLIQPPYLLSLHKMNATSCPCRKHGLEKQTTRIARPKTALTAANEILQFDPN